jgi:hypothetical protein
MDHENIPEWLKDQGIAKSHKIAILSGDIRRSQYQINYIRAHINNMREWKQEIKKSNTV